jgi:hypothetical protein
MKRYSGSTSSSQGNSLMVGGVAVAAVVALVFTSGNENPISQFQEQVFSDRVTALDAERTARNKILLLDESAKNAREIIERFGADGCEVIVNDHTEDVSAGRYHIALSEGMPIIDPMTRNPLPQGFCVRDHLGNVAVLGPGGIADVVFYDPALAQTDFTTDTTKTLGGQQ